MRLRNAATTRGSAWCSAARAVHWRKCSRRFGSARAALGPSIPAMFSYSAKLAEELKKLSFKADDPLWPMPLPGNWLLGSAIGVGVDSRDHVFIVHRGLPTLNARTEAGAAGAWGVAASEADVYPWGSGPSFSYPVHGAGCSPQKDGSATCLLTSQTGRIGGVDLAFELAVVVEECCLEGLRGSGGAGVRLSRGLGDRGPVRPVAVGSAPAPNRRWPCRPRR